MPLGLAALSERYFQGALSSETPCADSCHSTRVELERISAAHKLDASHEAMMSTRKKWTSEIGNISRLKMDRSRIDASGDLQNLKVQHLSGTKPVPGRLIKVGPIESRKGNS